MIKQPFFGLLSIIVVFANFSCSKEVTHHYLSEEFKSWSFFNKGSYWVYQNDSTLNLDSAFINSNPEVIDVPKDQDKGAPTYQNIAFTIHSKFYKYSKLVAGDGNESLYINIYNDYPVGLAAQPPKYFCSYFMSGVDEYTTLTYDSIFFIGSFKYLNVVHTHFSTNELSRNYDFSFARNIGLIKVIIETPDSTVSWSLIRNHAVQ
jgi:hypothetical protein